MEIFLESKLEPLPQKPLRLPQNANHLLQFLSVSGNKGKRIVSTVKRELQLKVNEIGEQYYKQYSHEQIDNLAILVLDVKNGEVLAYVGNSICPSKNCGGKVDLIQSKRSSGSTLKPFLYGFSLEEGQLFPNTLIKDVPTKIAEYQPENKKLEFHLTWVTAIGVAALLAPGLVVWNKYVTVPENVLKVEVMAYQWGWKYRLPGEDNILGKTSIKYINDENPFGLIPEDENSKDDLLVDSDELHLELGQSVKFELRSIDVLHNFYVPQFRGKMDMVPGIVTFYWLTPTRTGDFEVLCAEYCGSGHYAMRGRVIVDETKEYNDWVAQQITFEKFLVENSKEKTIKLVKN